jgi:diguanylate cyclase (GGDEF)-like protein/PAS domain S-box-containing protein
MGFGMAFGPGTDQLYLEAAFCLGMVALSLCVVFARLEALAYRRAQQRDKERLRQWSRRLADATFDGLVIHRNGIILSMNRALLRLLGVRETEVIGQHFATMAVAEQVSSLRAELEAPANQVLEFTLLGADRSERVVEISSQTIQHEGLPATVTAVRDITRPRADRARIDRLLNYDTLTGLANRTLFNERLAGAIAQNDAAGGTTVLFILDLDRLKSVNETIGRAGGDHLLRQIATRLGAMAHETDTVARISGDKFAIVQPHTGAPNRMQALASRLETTFGQYFVIDGQTVKASMSIGMAIYPDHATDAEGLQRAAGFALGIAAAQGGGASHLFSHAEALAAEPLAGRIGVDGVPRGLASEPQRLTQDLRAAIRRGEISVEYQPVFRARDLSLAGFEALARWRHPLEGWVPPNIFIPMAEQAGVIHEIGSFVLETACAKAVAAGGNWTMAINLSPLQFRDPLLPSRISAILQKTGLNPALLELEVTEGLLIDNAPAAQEALRAIRAVGVSIALDDFGTGYSSLSYLCDFPFNRLKIDKRFVQAFGREANAEAIITAILSLARNLNLEVTAEGVETPAQLSYLQEQGCHLVQGFLLGRPGGQVGSLSPLVKQAAGPTKPSLVIAN